MKMIFGFACIALLGSTSHAVESGAVPSPAEGAAARPDVVAPVAKPPLPTLITTSLSGRDLQFLMTVVETGRLQLWLGEVAKTRGESEQVKAMGEALLGTQQIENKHVTSLAQKNGLNVQEGAPAAQQTKLSSELANLKGAKLDKVVIEKISEASEKAVSAYSGALRSQDQEIRRFAEQMLPVAKEKLQLANKVAGKSTQSGATPVFRGETLAAPVKPQK